VTVTPTTYVYTAGVEEGVTVRLINYPRFPKQPEEIWERAKLVARELMDDLYQHSCTLEDPARTVWYSRRPEDNK
jgi:hypothetical protein